jgi:hypothetical protein
LRSIAKAEWIGQKELSPGEGGLRVESRRFGVMLDCETIGVHKVEVLFRDREKTLHARGVTWDVTSRITAAPKLIVVKADAGTTRVLLQSHDNQPFRVVRVDCDGPGLNCRANPETASLTQFIQVDGKPPGSQPRGTISVVTDHSKQGKVEVPFLMIE